MWSADRGACSSVLNRRIVSLGNGGSSGTVTNGRRLNASAFPFSREDLNFREYWYIDSVKFHLWILADAWGDIALFPLIKDSSGL